MQVRRWRCWEDVPPWCDCVRRIFSMYRELLPKKTPMAPRTAPLFALCIATAIGFPQKWPILKRSYLNARYFSLRASTASDDWLLYTEHHAGAWRGSWETFSPIGDRVDSSEVRLKTLCLTWNHSWLIPWRLLLTSTYQLMARAQTYIKLLTARSKFISCTCLLVDCALNSPRWWK